MHVSYNNLWKLLIDKRMSRSELRDVMNMRSKTAAKKGKEETVSTEVIMPRNEFAESIAMDDNTAPSDPSEEVIVPPKTMMERKIDRWKRELLDTGKRNKMINYRETKRTTLKIQSSPNLCVNCLQVELLITTLPGVPPVFWQSDAGDPVHRIPEVSDRSLC